MSFNGSGTFVINSVGNPTVTGTTISSTWANALTADLATGLSTCITKDGQTTTTGIIPFATPVTFASTVGDNTQFTATLTGCTTAPTYVAKYTKIGNVVIMTFVGTSLVTGTSNATTKTLTGMPAAIRPSGDVYAVGGGSDNGGSAQVTSLKIDSSGVINMYSTAIGAGTWTNSGTWAFTMPTLSWTTA